MEGVFIIFAIFIIICIFLLAAYDQKPNEINSVPKKKHSTPAPQTIFDCDFKLDLHGLDYHFYSKYYMNDDIYKGFIHHHKLFEIAQVIAKDKDEMLQASQFIVDKWTQMKGCRVHFGEVGLSKWNREEMGLEEFVLKCVSDNYDDDTRKRYEELDNEDWDDDDEDWNDYDDDLDDDDDDDLDDDIDIDEDDFGEEDDEEEEIKGNDKENPKNNNDEQDKKQRAKKIDIKTAKHYRSILQRMANRLDAIDREVDALCDDMESQRGNWGYYPSIRSMHENLECLRGDFSQIAEDMRAV